MSEEKSLTIKEFHEGLAEFSEQVLLPAVERIMDNRFDEFGKSFKKEMENMMDEKIDPISARLKTMELELEDIKLAIQRLDQRSDEDVSASYFDIDSLKKRVESLENQLKILQTERA